MYIEVLRSGLYTSIQDGGRLGFARYGVPESGVMDSYAGRFANLLTGNENSAAVLEITHTGPVLRFYGNHLLAVCGLGMNAFLNDLPVPLNEAFPVRKGDILDIQKVTHGNFLYLAVRGGLLSEKVLSSRSMYDGITPQFRLKVGDHLEVSAGDYEHEPALASVRFDAKRYATGQLPVYPGPEWSMLSESEKADLFQQYFTLTSESSRMAFIFKEFVKHKPKAMWSVPVLPGTIQLTSAGKLIALMCDAQVTGGYPRVLQITNEGLQLLAQKRPGQQIRFLLQTLD